MKISRHKLKTFGRVSFSALLVTLSSQAHALRGPDLVSGNDSGAVVVYRFDENGGDVAVDSVGGFNLSVSTEGNLPTNDGTQIRKNAVLGGGYLLINPKPNNEDMGYEAAQRHRTFLESAPVGAKFNQCATNGFTIQAFVRAHFPFNGNDDDGNMIVGFSNSDLDNLRRPNFALYQTGENGAVTATVRSRRDANGAMASLTSVPEAFSSVRADENPGQLTEIIATQDPNGQLTIYVNRIARSALATNARNFSSTAKLVIGNELTKLTTMSQNGNIVANVANQRNWSGEIHHLAIYCRHFSRVDVLGAVAENKSRLDIVKPIESVSIASSAMRPQAQKMVERLVGGPVPPDHPMIARVEAKLLAGDRVGAAKIITGDAASNEPGHPNFLNITVKQMAIKMSNREETIRAPLNDMAASFIGVTRDETSAKELLTGNFFYMADPAKTNVRRDMFRDLVTTNNHYQDLDDGQWDIGKVLVRVDQSRPYGAINGQQIAVTSAGSLVENPDPAGVITSRAFMSAHAIAGTNRRPVEYAFKQFLCVPMSEMADTSASPARIGRDIDRFPGGDAVKFETNCKGCHTVMDGFRGAFAFFDFAPGGYVRNTKVNAKNSAFGFPMNTVDSNNVVRKMNHNENAFPNGYEITDDSFVNNAVGSTNRTVFGWAGSNKNGGFGVGQFGKMIADSKRFSQCMAKRAFESVCAAGQREQAKVTPVIEAIGEKFEQSGYKMRALFQEVAAHPACGMNLGR